MAKLTLFSAIQASRTLANKANLEARYNELTRKAIEYNTKPNNALLGIVNAFERLVKSAMALGKDPISAMEAGMFDATLSEYRRLAGIKSFEESQAKILKEKDSALSALSALGKDLSHIAKYYDAKLANDVLPMQAFELIAKRSGIVSAFEFGTELHDVVNHEYRRAIALRDQQRAIRTLESPVKTDAEKNKAMEKLHLAQQELKSLSMPATEPAQKAKAKSKKVTA